MHTEMWEHPATRANVALLRARGVVVIEPAVGRLTGADTGKGRLPDPAEIFAVARARAAARPRSRPRRPARRGHRRRHPRAARPGALPRQPLVRQAGLRPGAHRRGPRRAGDADRGERHTADPAGADVVRVGTTEELRKATVEAAAGADVGGDGRRARRLPARHRSPTRRSRRPTTARRRRSSWSPTRTSPPSWARAKPPGQVLVAFAAETHDALENARGKLTRKRADLIVVNEVGVDRVFGADAQHRHHPRRRRQHRRSRRTAERRCGRCGMGPWSPRARAAGRPLWDGVTPRRQRR